MLNRGRNGLRFLIDPLRSGGPFVSIDIAEAGTKGRFYSVANSYEGALALIDKELGLGNIEIDERNHCAMIAIPDHMLGSWIGKDSSVLKFLKNALGLRRGIRYVRVENWKRRNTDQSYQFLRGDKLRRAS